MTTSTNSAAYTTAVATTSPAPPPSIATSPQVPNPAFLLVALVLGIVAGRIFQFLKDVRRGLGPERNGGKHG